MNTCLVIIDVQNGFISDRTNHIPDKIVELVKNQNNLFSHIVATKFKNLPDSPYEHFMNWHGLTTSHSQELDSRIQTIPERIFVKHTYSCWTDEFKEFLKKNGIKKLYFLGIDTDCCVLKSASDAFEYNFPFEVLLNYSASNGGKESHEAAIKVMQRMLGVKSLNFSL